MQDKEYELIGTGVIGGDCYSASPEDSLAQIAIHSQDAFPTNSRSPRTKVSMAFANPSSSFEVVTNFASRCTSGLALPMAMLSPVYINISTSFGMSPIVAICAGGMDSTWDKTATT